ncbi:MAG: UDP-N-acetylglucosamine 1-carboxyvinyltransferase [Chitinispirillaceae bacterium]|nr:UDP-N-acetylglucosamine 1-carboxyvinyltransferase [Chitinispirillaceae bacterium]
MSRFIVEGGRKLSGTVTVAGNKNEALPLIAASLLCSGPVTFSNVPDIGDVRTMITIAGMLGAKTTRGNNGTVTIDASTITTSMLPVEQSSAIRASILFASSLLVRTGRAVIIQPGGDPIGRRRLDTHFLAFKALGARVRIERRATSDTVYSIDAPQGLHGTILYLDEASVTGTENAILAAAGAEGTTTIMNAASEPHVQGLCRFLEKIGVVCSGVGSNVLTIRGTAHFSTSVEYTVGADYIEAGSFIGLAAATGSSLAIRGADPEQMRMILLQFERIGVTVECSRGDRTLHVPDRQQLCIQRDLGTAIPRIEDSPWPGFPTDLMSILLVTATQSTGTCLIHEKMFESRLYFVDKLIAMGAQIVLCDPHRAVVVGPSPLYGATISSPDIRAGMALLIAALAAEGKSAIDNIAQIDRGYERIDERLRMLGAVIERTGERLKSARG